MERYRNVRNVILEVFSSNPIVQSSEVTSEQDVLNIPTYDLLVKLAQSMRETLLRKEVALDDVDAFLRDRDAYQVFLSNVANRKSHKARSIDEDIIDKTIRNIWFFVKNPERLQ